MRLKTVILALNKLAKTMLSQGNRAMQRVFFIHPYIHRLLFASGSDRPMSKYHWPYHWPCSMIFKGNIQDGSYLVDLCVPVALTEDR